MSERIEINQEIPSEDIEERKERSRYVVNEAIITQLKITDSHLSFDKIGIKLDPSMVERDSESPQGYRVKVGIVEKIIEKAEETCEQLLDSKNPQRDPYWAAKIAGDFVDRKSVV
jgi:hypothetical protein